MSNNYVGLRWLKKQDRVAAIRCAERLLAMRTSLAGLRRRKRDSSLLLATWNIRDFDSNKFGFGPRLPEAFYYIAEIISCFDLVAVQEVNRDLSALETVMRILGPDWDFIATDATEGRSGNNERMAFVYNRDKIRFRKVAGEVVLPDGQLVVARKKVAAAKGEKPKGLTAEETRDVKKAMQEVGQQFARTPFVVAFQAGWFKFSLCTVHIYYGEETGPKLDQRVDEINKLVGFFARRQDAESKQEAKSGSLVENYILLGDFNVVSPEHKTMAALKSKGFKVPAAIDGKAVRKTDKDHFYDQIAVRVKDPRFKVAAGGMVDMYADVFRDNATDLAIYKSKMPRSDPEKDAKFKAKTPQALFRKWRTWQMSDHSPLWVEIETDFADDYLDKLKA